MLCEGEMVGILRGPAPAQAGYCAVLPAAVGAARGYSLSLTQDIPWAGASLTLHCVARSFSYIPAEPVPLLLPLQHHGTQLAASQRWQSNGTWRWFSISRFKPKIQLLP